jgi:hypothetical protein
MDWGEELFYSHIINHSFFVKLKALNLLH